MSRPFTIIGAIILLAVAAAHAVRIAAGASVIIGSYEVPMVASWIAATVAAFVGMMTIIELRR
jgi:hypothetical protein